jgi:hypothetical protein
MQVAYFLVSLAGVGVLLSLLTLSSPGAPEPPAGPDAAGALGSPPSGADGPKKRSVLVVGRPGKDRRADELLLREAGYGVRSCAGPEGALETFPYGQCRILNEGLCALAAGTDAIVFGLPLDTLAARSVLRGYRKTYPETPIFVRTSDRESEWFAKLLRDCQVSPRGYQDDLAAAIGVAIDSGGVDPS